MLLEQWKTPAGTVIKTRLSHVNAATHDPEEQAMSDTLSDDAAYHDTM
jgi:hypothetical protein